MTTEIARKYALPNLFFLDTWPIRAPLCVIVNPEIARQINQGKVVLPKPAMSRNFSQPLVGSKSILLSNGNEWKRQRSIFAPGFSSTHLIQLVGLIVDHTQVYCQVLADAAQKQEICQLERTAAKLTVDIIGKVVLDHNFNSQLESNEFVEAFRSSMTWFAGSGPNINPIRWYMQRRYKGIMDRYVKRILREHFHQRAKTDISKKSLTALALKAYMEETHRAVNTVDAEFEQFIADKLVTPTRTSRTYR